MRQLCREAHATQSDSLWPHEEHVTRAHCLAGTKQRTFEGRLNRISRFVQSRHALPLVRLLDRRPTPPLQPKLGGAGFMRWPEPL
jgi:hypothetical protein